MTLRPALDEFLAVAQPEILGFLLFCKWSSTARCGADEFDTKTLACRRHEPRWTPNQYAGMWGSNAVEESYWIDDIEGTIPPALEARSIRSATLSLAPCGVACMIHAPWGYGGGGRCTEPT